MSSRFFTLYFRRWVNQANFANTSPMHISYFYVHLTIDSLIMRMDVQITKMKCNEKNYHRVLVNLPLVSVTEDAASQHQNRNNKVT